VPSHTADPVRVAIAFPPLIVVPITIRARRGRVQCVFNLLTTSPQGESEMIRDGKPGLATWSAALQLRFAQNDNGAIQVLERIAPKRLMSELRDQSVASDAGCAAES